MVQIGKEQEGASKSKERRLRCYEIMIKLTCVFPIFILMAVPDLFPSVVSAVLNFIPPKPLIFPAEVSSLSPPLPDTSEKPELDSGLASVVR